jgi:hypothetical protein
VDAERDFIGANLTDTASVTRQEYLHGPAPVFLAQTASGEDYHSDSRILLLDLHQNVPSHNVVDQPAAVVRAVAVPIGAPVEPSQSNLTSFH